MLAIVDLPVPDGPEMANTTIRQQPHSHVARARLRSSALSPAAAVSRSAGAIIKLEG